MAFGITALSWIGMPFDDTRLLTHLLAFLIYLLVACWAFAAARLAPVCLVLLGGGAAMTGLAWFMTRSAI
jgi:hypothetical protein